MLTEKRTKAQFIIDDVYKDLFVKNDTLKLYDKTIKELQKAKDTEEAFREELLEQIKEMKDLVSEECIQRDEYKNFQTLQRKQIETLGTKH